MSVDAFAALRRTQGEELGRLAEEHFKHDLREEDRDLLRSAASKASTHAFIGSLAGIALGSFLAFRLRANRNAMYQAFRAAEKPTHVRFASGREEAIPDITPLLQPTPLGDVMTYTFFGIAGLFLGGETGLLTGTWSARRTIAQDPDRRERIEKAFRSFRADVLRKQLQELEAGKEESIWS
ncbi:hypothetical protein, variant [Cladophialophora immunda]|uniref:Transmembrane protein n=1 Tax=Cladophialophora immunda TaxID=569365 RepID=A0A0D1Z732_9EURO|nr:uncharacterized protein PV07_11611 [Cladophialophora immunda]XP_016243628.1 hypothetical protein, variant [Cladophialophora immunda]KIW23411.1 hypothetical protein PV07_11611 [Cladophialophora immunda]KIW23412.1 hypothetical protein, variant [Cladophialophora immunda]OQV03774.1 hypothetical protein CLAIMM_08775 [Cladophialophora immunda]